MLPVFEQPLIRVGAFVYVKLVYLPTAVPLRKQVKKLCALLKATLPISLR